VRRTGTKAFRGNPSGYRVPPTGDAAAATTTS
jgi:hypothetical protein